MAITDTMIIQKAIANGDFDASELRILGTTEGYSIMIEHDRVSGFYDTEEECKLILKKVI